MSEDEKQIRIEREKKRSLAIASDRPLNRSWMAIPFLRRLQLRSSNTAMELRDRLHRTCVYEVEAGTAFNFLPVFISFGIGIYFAVPSEPNFWALFISFLICSALLLRLRGDGYGHFVLAALMAVFMGACSAKFATFSVEAPAIERQITVKLQGVVIGSDQNRRGAPRYLVKPIVLGSMSSDSMPERLRISASAKHFRFLAGDKITGVVRLQPISGPVIAGSYDFSFFAWFNGLRGSGFFMGAPATADFDVLLSLREKTVIAVNRFRFDIEKRILAALPGTSGDVAVALVTGNKSGIPEDVQQSLRKTGLAHILAISGLHMALVTLTVVWFVRLVLARVSTLAHHYPIKKIAALSGFASATFYLTVSGGGVATQRAWIMISVMLFAVLMDRKAITMRSVALSAIIILVISPESIFSPGFQMSFAAVSSLVAGYEFINQRRRHQSENGLPTNLNHRVWAYTKTVGTYFSGIIITSLIAGTATAFVAAWHFNQIASLGLIANVLAMPIVSLIVMPFVLTSVLLMPYGLETLALLPVGFGIDTVVSISKWIEGFSPNGETGLLPNASLVFFGLFLAGLTVPKTRLRFFALAFLPVLFLLPERERVPDIVIAENGRSVAIRNITGELTMLVGNERSFVGKIWRKAWGRGQLLGFDLPDEQCNRERCMIVLPNSKVLHLVYDPQLLRSSCQRADVLVAPRLWWVNCPHRTPEIVLKRFDFERYGTHEIRFPHQQETNGKRQSKYEIARALKQENRPWSRKVQPIKSLSEIRGKHASDTDE